MTVRFICYGWRGDIAYAKLQRVSGRDINACKVRAGKKMRDAGYLTFVIKETTTRMERTGYEDTRLRKGSWF